MLQGEKLATAAHRDFQVCMTDLLMNPVTRKQKPGRPDLFYGRFRSLQENVHYLCKFLTYSHQIYITGASYVGRGYIK